MANWTNLKSAISRAIASNNNQEITGQILQNTLISIINNVGENATFAGIAIPTTNPGIPDGPVFYLAFTPGLYSNFGGVTVADSAVFTWSEGTWKIDLVDLHATSTSGEINVGLVKNEQHYEGGSWVVGGGMNSLIEEGSYRGLYFETGASDETFFLLVLNTKQANSAGVSSRDGVTQIKVGYRLDGVAVSFQSRIRYNKLDDLDAPIPGEYEWSAWENLRSGGAATVEAQAPLSQENGKLSLNIGDGLKVEDEKLVLDDFVREGAVVEYDEENKRLEFKGLSDTSTAVNSAKSLALRELFVAAGAEYNDSGSAIEKDTPWGEKILHLPGCYHFNHIGDLTEEDMAYIIANQSIVYHLNIPRLRQKDTKLRTFIPLFNNQGVESLPSIAHSTFSLCYNLEVVKFTARVELENIDPERYRTGGSYMFFNCNKLKFIQPLRLTATTTVSGMFEGCKSLIEVEIYNLAGSISFSDSNLINKKSILCAIQNAAPTSAITITLHPNAYTRLANDVDIIAALRAKPLVTLVSA